MKIIKIHSVLIMAMAISTLPIIVMLFVLFAYTMTQNDQRKTEMIKSTQITVLDALDFTLSETGSTCADLSNSMDFLIFCNSSGRSRVFARSAKLIETARKQLFNHSSVTAIFLYNSQCDYLYNTYKFNAASQIQSEASEILKSEPPLIPSKTWVTRTIQDRPILFYMVRSRYGSLMIAVDPSQEDAYKNIKKAAEADASWYFQEPHDTQTSEARTIAADNTINATAKNARLRFVYEDQQSDLWKQIDQQQMVMLILIIILILLVPFMWLMINFVLLKPLRKLSTSIHEIRGGNLEHRADITGRIAELRIFASSFNSMLDSISQLKLENYENQLSATRARLQYLQLQIRPHFYLNCLKNMYSLLDLHDYERIREMILALSAYFAHAFRDVKNFITLLDELHACTSYIDLQNIVSPKAELVFDIQSQCAGAECLPLSVLTFVENCIKHCHGDEWIKIVITASTFMDEAADMEKMTITIRDNGGGFPEDVLKQLNENDPSLMVYRHEKVGISNLCYRFWLIYRENARISFYNENGHGIVKICMPYYRREDESS